jgi:hypothetical protein
MKKPNPIFLGLIVMVALLPHMPRLLPNGMPPAEPAYESPAPAAPISDDLIGQMSAAELSPTMDDKPNCTDLDPVHSAYENETLYPEAEPEDALPDSPLTEANENCDTGWNLSQRNIHSVHPMLSTHIGVPAAPLST